MADWSPLHARLHQTLHRGQWLPEGAVLLVAVSGGQDSVCLLKLLRDLRPHWGWEMGVVHADHRWRADSTDNAAFVGDLCDRWGLPCHIVTATDPVRSEAAARQWRYSEFGRLARQHRCCHLVTGHTATDRAETLLYNLVRGSGSRGLQALGWQRPLDGKFLDQPDLDQPALDQPDLDRPIWLVRPMLGITRAETAACCQTYHLPTWEDATNQDLTYARNRLRQRVFPELRQLNPQVERTLAHAAEVLSAEVDYLDTVATALYDQVVQPPAQSATGGWQVYREPLRCAPLALQRRVLWQLMQQVATRQVNFEQVEQWVALISAPNRSQSAPLAGGWVARVVGPNLVLVQPRSGDGGGSGD